MWCFFGTFVWIFCTTRMYLAPMLSQRHTSCYFFSIAERLFIFLLSIKPLLLLLRGLFSVCSLDKNVQLLSWEYLELFFHCQLKIHLLLMLCVVKTELAYSDSNRVFKLSELFKEWLYQFYIRNGLPQLSMDSTDFHGFAPRSPELVCHSIYYTTLGED